MESHVHIPYIREVLVLLLVAGLGFVDKGYPEFD